MDNRKKDYVKKRKSYYGFSRYYPGKIGSKTYIIGDSVNEKRRESARRIIIAVVLILLFIAAFVVTDVCLNISEMKV